MGVVTPSALRTRTKSVTSSSEADIGVVISPTPMRSSRRAISIRGAHERCEPTRSSPSESVQSMIFTERSVVISRWTSSSQWAGTAYR